jgi:hypothetical protein
MACERIEIQAMKKYPDISKLLEQKERHRRHLAALPFERKIEMVFRLQLRRELLQGARAVKADTLPSLKPHQSSHAARKGKTE